jgi:CelD/BcsL family acetyltransferase involved in cellulose biosynthesis
MTNAGPVAIGEWMTSNRGLQMRSVIVSDFLELEALADDWARLRQTSPRLDVFNTFAWARASWRAYGDKHFLYTPVVYKGSEVLGIFPLVVDQGTLRFLGGGHSDYNDLLCLPYAAADILESALWSLFKPPMPWNQCMLENIPENSVICGQRGKLPRILQRRLNLAFSSLCPTVVFSCGGEDTLKSILKKKSLCRHEKNLQKLGKVTFRHMNSREEIRSHLPNLFRQHIARRALDGDESIFCRDEPRQFYLALLEELDPREDLRFAVLELNGRAIAYHLGFESEGKFLWYKPTFDVGMWEYSPGEVLIKQLFEYAGSREIHEFDFTVGNEQFKSRFANRFNRNYTLYVSRSWPHSVAKKMFLFAADVLKQCPPLHLAVRNFKTNTKKTFSRATYAIRRHGLLGVARINFLIAFRALILRYDHVIVFSFHDVADSVENKLGCGQVESGTLEDIAYLSMEHAEHFTQPLLKRATDRLRNGDRVWVVREKGACIHVSWTKVSNEIKAVYETGTDCTVKLDCPAVLICESWTSPEVRRQGIYSRVLREIATSALKNGKGCYSYSLSGNHSSVQEIKKSGFKPRYRIRRIMLMSLFAWSWISDVP